MQTTQYLTGLTAPEVYELAGNTSDVLTALVKAERSGSARVNAATIVHTGYQRDVTEFNAGTALYRVSW